MARLHLPKEKVEDASRFFFGVRDPEYGEIPYEQAFNELYDRANQYLDAFAAAYAHDVSASAMRLPQF